MEKQDGEPYSTAKEMHVLQVAYRSAWIWELESKATQIWSCHFNCSVWGS